MDEITEEMEREFASQEFFPDRIHFHCSNPIHTNLVHQLLECPQYSCCHQLPQGFQEGDEQEQNFSEQHEITEETEATEQ